MAEITEKDRDPLGQEVVQDPTRIESNSEPVEKSPPTITHHVSPKTGADAALELLRETGSLHQPLDPSVNRRLVRRIDTHIMPLICIVW